MKLSNRAESIVPYTAGEQAEGYIKLNTNENPYPPSPKVEDALKRFSYEKLRLYPSIAAEKLVKAIAAYEKVNPSSVFVGNGSDEVLAFAFAAFYDRPAVEFPDLTYSFYPVYAKLFDIATKTVPLKPDFTVDFDAFDARGGAVICNPNAPTTLAAPLENIAALAEKTDRMILVDEAYIDFADVPSATTLIAAHPNIAVVKTLSKSYSLAGLRCGYMIADPKAIEAVAKIRDSFNSYTTDRVCEAAATAAIEDVSYRDMTVRFVKATRDRVIERLHKGGVKVLPSQTNFLFMEGSKELYLKFKENGILVRHFDKPILRDYLRVTVGTDADMDKFLEVLFRLRQK